jgi:hypothetical protein
MATSFDSVREIAGESAGPELVSAVERMTLDQVDALADHLLDASRTAALPDKPVTEIWPLVPLRASIFFDHLNNESPASGYAPTGIQLSEAINPRSSGTGAFSSGIIRALLYSHGLSIEDPLSHAAEMHLSQHRETREISRLAISAAVASLSEIADLLDGDIVRLFYTGGDELASAGQLGDTMLAELDGDGAPYSLDDAWDEFEVEFVSGLTAPLQALWKEIRGGNRTPDLNLVQQAVSRSDSHLADTFVDVVRILNPRSIVENAVAGTACTVAVIRLLGGSSDVLCASPLMARLLFLGTPDPVQQLRVQEIARTTVPNISALSPRDLVAIRQASEAFAVWRHDLAAALDYAERVRQTGVDPRVVQAGVEEMLADAREKVRAEADRTRVWSRGNLVSFVAGGIGGAGGAVVGGTSGAIAAGAGAGVIASFIQARGQRRRVAKFLDRHYVAFARSEPQR